MNPDYDADKLLEDYGSDYDSAGQAGESIALQRATYTMLKELLKLPNGWTRVQGYVPRNGDDDGPPLTTGVLAHPADTPDTPALPSATDAAVAAAMSENQKTIRILEGKLTGARKFHDTLAAMLKKDV